VQDLAGSGIKLQTSCTRGTRDNLSVIKAVQKHYFLNLSLIAYFIFSITAFEIKNARFLSRHLIPLHQRLAASTWWCGPRPSIRAEGRNGETTTPRGPTIRSPPNRLESLFHFPFLTSGTDLGAWPNCWVSVEFLHAPIPRKGSGSTTTTTLDS